METRLEKHNKKGRNKVKAPVSGKPKRWYKRKGFLWTTGIIVFLLLAVVGYYTYYIGHFLNKIQTPHTGEKAVTSADAWSGTDPVNIVLFGVDNRNNDPHPRSDSIIIIHIDPVTKQAKVMSVLRDTWYNIPDYGYEKINAAMAFGGPDLAIKTLKQFLGIPINYYVKTDFQGFIGIVNAMGGIDLNVEKPLHYADDGVYDINLNAGYQHLDGQHALMYVRFRHDAMSDFARTQRQRNFLQAVAKKMATPSSLAKLPQILDAASPYIETNIPTGDMLKLAMLARSVDVSNIPQMQVPPMNDLKEGTAGGGQSVLFPNVADTRKAVYQFLGMDLSQLPTDNSDQPPGYYDQNPVAAQNPDVDSNGNVVSTKPVTPAPAPTTPSTPPSQSSSGSNPFGDGNSKSAGSGSSSGAGTSSSSGSGSGASSGTGTTPTPPVTTPPTKPTAPSGGSGSSGGGTKSGSGTGGTSGGSSGTTGSGSGGATSGSGTGGSGTGTMPPPSGTTGKSTTSSGSSATKN